MHKRQNESNFADDILFRCFFVFCVLKSVYGRFPVENLFQAGNHAVVATRSFCIAKRRLRQVRCGLRHVSLCLLIVLAMQRPDDEVPRRRRCSQAKARQAMKKWPPCPIDQRRQEEVNFDKVVEMIGDIAEIVDDGQ